MESQTKRRVRKLIGFILSLVLVVITVRVVLATPIALGGSNVSDMIVVEDSVTFFEYGNYYELNNTHMSVELYKDSQGYDVLNYANGTVAIYEERLFVEYWRTQGGGRWNQIGTPQKTGYYADKDGFTVWRWFNDYSGTTYYVYYTLKPNQPLKVSVELDDTSLSNRAYRVVWALDGITHSQFKQGGNLYEYDDIIIDFQDVASSWGDISVVGHSTTGNGRKAEYVFNVGAQNKFILDPTISIGEAAETEYYPTTPAQPSGVVIDSNDNLYAAFTNASSNNITLVVYKSEDYGANWTLVASRDSNTDFGGIRALDIVINSSDAIIVSGYAVGVSLFAIYTEDGFSTYAENTTPLPTNVDIKQFDSISLSNGEMHAIMSTDFQDIYHATWNEADNNWNASIVWNRTGESTVNNYTQEMLLTSDSTNEMHAYLRLRSGEIHHMNKTYNGVAWDTENLTSQGSIDLLAWSSAAVGNNDELYLFSSNDYLYSTDQVTWTYIEHGDVIYPTLAVTDTNMIYACSSYESAWNLDQIVCLNSSDDGHGVTFSTCTGFEGCLKGGDIGDTNKQAPRFGNTNYPLNNNGSNILRYIYSDTDTNVVYYSFIKLQSIAPITGVPTFTAASYATTDDITVNVSYLSETLETGTVYCEWYIDGVATINTTDAVSTSGQTAQCVLGASNFTKGEVINVTAFAKDNDTLTSTTLQSNTTTIQNTASVVDSVIITPSTPEPDETLTCNYNSSDADSDTMSASYEWYIDAVAQSLNTSTLGPSNTTLGQVIICQVFVNDSAVNSDASNSSSRTIGDTTDPTINTIGLSKTTVSNAGNLAFTMTCSDTWSAISEVKATVTKPDASVANSTLTLSEGTYSVTYTDVTDVGTYTVGPWYCKDSSNNLATTATTINFTSSVVDSGLVGGGGGGSPIILTLVETEYIQQLFCGDGQCTTGESPNSCPDDCQINVGNVITCIFTDETCVYSDAWFAQIIIFFLVAGFAYLIIIGGRRKSK